MSIGIRIAKRRKELKITRTALAKKVGVSITAIQKIEDGKTKNPKYVLKIAEILGVNPSWLQFGGNAEKAGAIKLSDDELRLIAKYRQLNQEEKKFVVKCVSGLVEVTYENA